MTQPRLSEWPVIVWLLGFYLVAVWWERGKRVSYVDCSMAVMGVDGYERECERIFRQMGGWWR